MERFSNYIKATLLEMKHVKWPTQQQAMNYTALVLGISIVTTIFVMIFDFIFTSGMQFFTSLANPF